MGVTISKGKAAQVEAVGKTMVALKGAKVIETPIGGGVLYTGSIFEKTKQDVVLAQQEKAAEMELVDRFIELKAKVDLIMADPIHAAFVAAKKQLMELADIDRKPEEDFALTGTKGTVQFGAKAQSRSIFDMNMAKELLGEETFMAVAKINLTDLDKYLTEDQKDQCIKAERTGSRSVKVIATVK